MKHLARLTAVLSDRVPKAAAAVLKLAPVIVGDGAGVAGVGLVAYGSWLVYAPAGFIVAGVLLIAGAFLSGRARVA